MTPLFSWRSGIDASAPSEYTCANEISFFVGPCLYFTSGYTGFRLVKNLTPSTSSLNMRRLPREEKSTVPLVHHANLRKQK
jgi:hypothetical protein